MGRSMKRNRFGINLDEGISLQTEWEFENLYVSCHDDTYRELIIWLKEQSEPLQFGGQIGSGKSSVILKSFKDSDVKPDIIFHFDQEGLNLSSGDFLRIILTGFCEFALNNDVDLSSYTLPEEMADLSRDDWEGFLGKLSPDDFSLDAYKKKSEISRQLADNAEYYKKVIKSIGDTIQKTIDHPLFIFASGIDKYDTECAAYFSLQSIIATLLPYKTLFEVNAVHLFHTSKELSPIEKLFLPSMTVEKTEEIINRRMGVYAGAVKNELAVLSKWSAGNPRQAIRLLTYFETARKNRTNSFLDCILFAVRSTTRDFFAFSSKPSLEIMRYVKQNEKIEATEFILPGDKDTARRALYGNWFFITGTAQDSRWPAKINPLVRGVFDVKTKPEEPEVKALRIYAEQSGVSSTGLSFLITSDNGEKESGEKLEDFLSRNIEHPLSSNLSEVLDTMAAALLSKNRLDRVIIVFKDSSVVEAARAYLFAKANSYEYQRCSHVLIAGGENRSPLQDFLEHLQEDTDIYSLQFGDSWTKDQLQSFDKLRDHLTQYQMIWWIEHDKLTQYLQEWTQLRQLFEVFILDDELLGSLSIEELEGDLEFFKNLVDDKNGSEANVVRNLKVVLEYLQAVKGGENG